MPSRSDTYEDGDGNVWAFDPPYDEDLDDQAASDHQRDRDWDNLPSRRVHDVES